MTTKLRPARKIRPAIILDSSNPQWKGPKARDRLAACYSESMANSLNPSHSRWPSAGKICVLLLFLIVAIGAAHAQSSSSVFSGPQNMDQGLQSGMNNITGYVFAILKFLSIIGLGIAYYFVTHNGLGKAILATIASILLWFAPVVANIAQSLGSSAAQQSQVTTSSGS